MEDSQQTATTNTAETAAATSTTAAAATDGIPMTGPSPAAAAGTATATTSPAPIPAPAETAPKTELRTDGPTVQEYVAAGYKATAYPPAGYASRSTDAEIQAAIAAQPSKIDQLEKMINSGTAVHITQSGDLVAGSTEHTLNPHGHELPAAGATEAATLGMSHAAAVSDHLAEAAKQAPHHASLLQELEADAAAFIRKAEGLGHSLHLDNAYDAVRDGLRWIGNHVKAAL